MKNVAVITVKYKSDSGAKKPTYKTEGASGADLHAYVDRDVILKVGEIALIRTGVYLEIPMGFEGQIRPRSGLAVKHGVTVINAPGTIDSDYRGELKVGLINLGREDFIIRNGDRIAQIVFSPVIKANFLAVEEISDSKRGDGGFGSTGIND